MALYLCPEEECGKKVSSTAKTCPKCGCRVKKIFKERERIENNEPIKTAGAKDPCFHCGSEKVEIEQNIAYMFNKNSNKICPKCERLSTTEQIEWGTGAAGEENIALNKLVKKAKKKAEKKARKKIKEIEEAEAYDAYLEPNGPIIPLAEILPHNLFDIIFGHCDVGENNQT